VLKREEISRALTLPVIEIFTFESQEIVVSSDLQRYNLKKINQKFHLNFSDEKVDAKGVYEFSETKDYIFLKTF